MSGRRANPLLWLLLVMGPALAAEAADFRSLLLQAQSEFEQEHFDKALGLYRQADEAEPDHAAVAYNIGLCHERLDDGEKAIQQFEKVSSRTDIATKLRQEAFYNIGVIRAESARAKFDEVLSPSTQPADQVGPDDPSNIETLQAIGDGLLSAIASFRQAQDLRPSEEGEHNIRAARLLRRNVLGLLRRALENKEKEDIRKDPRAYLEQLLFEQDRQLALSRYVVMSPPQERLESRAVRRASLRAQRTLMEQTGMLADELAQFREQAQDPGVPPATQPADKTPMEQAYHAVAEQLEQAVDRQRDACAFLLDGEIEPAAEQQMRATEMLFRSWFGFPFEPADALVKARGRQRQLRDLVHAIERNEDWLWEPALGPARIPDGVERDVEQSGIARHQGLVGAMLMFLSAQCEQVAATSRPEGEADPGSPPGPMLDPELNRQLAEILQQVEEPLQAVIGAIFESDKETTLRNQDRLIEIIDEALAILPKTLPQKIRELIARQAQLNADTMAEAGGQETEAASPLDKIRRWAAKIRDRLLPKDASEVAERLREDQKTIQGDTAIVNDEVRRQIPAGAGATPPGGVGNEQLQKLIKVNKHMTEAGSLMSSAIKGLDEAIVEDSLRPLAPEGPVPTAQSKALEQLLLALFALEPPQAQPQQENEQQQDEDEQEQPEDQDTQRSVDQIDREREAKRQELFQRRPREVIKDW